MTTESGGADSGIVRDLDPGTYFIAVGVNNISAFEPDATENFDHPWGNDSGALAPGLAAIKIGFIGASDNDNSENEPYRIEFNFTTSDHPVTIADNLATIADNLATIALKKKLRNEIKKLKRQIKKAKRGTSSAKLKRLKKKLKTAKKRLRNA